MESMNIVEGILLTAGIILAFIGSIMILINAFKQNVGWGICSLLIPFAMPIYTFIYWDQNKRGFGIWFSGFLFYIGALIFFAREGVFRLHPLAG